MIRSNKDLSHRQAAAIQKFHSAIAYQNEGNSAKAIISLKEAIELSPELPAPYYVLGSLLQQQGQLDDAIACYKKILTISPNHADTHTILGSAYQVRGDLEEAISCYKKAVASDGNSFMAYNNLGTALRLRGDLDEAIESYTKALQIKPDFTAAMNNLGTALRDQGKLDEAIIWYRQAIALNPHFADAHWNLSFALLLAGQYAEGWQEYEWIWKLNKTAYRLPHPVWDGRNIQGQRILLYAEQGFGDVIQFVRYAPMVADKGAEVIIGCQRELKPLMKSVAGVRSVAAFGESVRQFDVQCPLPSLPRLFNTTLDCIPRRVPYMHADVCTVESWRHRLSLDNAKLNVGLAWAGSPGHLNDRNRSCPLRLFLPLAGIDGIRLVSLQKEIYEKWTADTLADFGLIDHTRDIDDFSDTAAIIMNLDLVITVDTAVAHLAGALGKTVWTLLPFAPDWRWMLDRDDSPWYPTMRLFRQHSPGNWESVISKVDAELKNFMRISRR